MRETWFLELDGISGESQDVRHRDEIEVQSWSWGVSSASNPMGGPGGVGGAGGKAAFEDFQFSTHVSAASPPLFLACATGRHLRTATLTGVRGGGGAAGFEFLTYALTDVTVAHVHHGDATGGAPVEQFALRFAKVEMTYRPQLPTGAAGTPVTAVFDVGRNR